MNNDQPVEPEVSMSIPQAAESTLERRRGDRRKREIPVAVDRRVPEDRRNLGERRGRVDPTTCERDYNDEEVVFMKAMDQYKRDNRRPFPTWSEVLEVLKSLGYQKVAAAKALPGLSPKNPTDEPAPPPKG